jgi:hypothetical protein
MKLLVLDPKADLDATIDSIGTFSGVDDIQGNLALFDGLFVLKEGFPPSFGANLTGDPNSAGVFQAPEGERRLVVFNDDPVQNFLSERKVLRSQKFLGSRTLLDVMEEIAGKPAQAMQADVPVQIILPRDVAEKMPVQRPSLLLSALDGFSTAPPDTPLEEILNFNS